MLSFLQWSFLPLSRCSVNCSSDRVFGCRSLYLVCRIGSAITPPVERSSDKSQKTAAFRWGQVLTLAGAHFAHDLYTALLAPWLPLLIRKLSLSMLQAGSLTMFLQMPSLFNPWLGLFVDRRNLARTFVILGPAVTGLAMSLLGVAPSYGLAALLLLVTGVSVAALHVSAPVVIAEAAGDRVGLGMSLHMVGGQIARTLGPLLAAAALSWFGLHGSWRLFPIGLAASALVWWRVDPAVDGKTGRSRAGGLRRLWKRMGRDILGMSGVVVARLFLSGAVTSFLPTFLIRQGEGLWMSNVGLSVFAASGAVGVSVSGPLSDRLGRRIVLLGAVTLSPLLMMAFLAWSGLARLLLLALLGFVALSTSAPLMALMLERAGEDRAAANGIYMMVGFASSSVIVPLIGLMADLFGLYHAYWICAVVSLAALPFALMLSKDTGRLTP